MFYFLLCNFSVDLHFNELRQTPTPITQNFLVLSVSSEDAREGPSQILSFILHALGNELRRVLAGKKKEPKSKLFGPDISGWGGGLPREGVGAEKFGMSLETGKPTFFGGISQDFAGISRRCPKTLRNKSLCSIFVPYFGVESMLVSFVCLLVLLLDASKGRGRGV